MNTFTENPIVNAFMMNASFFRRAPIQGSGKKGISIVAGPLRGGGGEWCLYHIVLPCTFKWGLFPALVFEII